MSKHPYAKGITLTETLITLAIVGLVLIPTLLTSSAYFSSRIVKVREQLGLSHDVSLMLQQLSTALAQSPRLIPSTTADTFTPATELRYSYRDPIRNEQRYGGLRLVDSGGRRQVQALTYNGTTWATTSPYRSHPSTAYTLATSAVFDYCNDSACSLTPDQATYVKISGWTFRNEANLAQTLPLAELRLVIGSQLPEAEGQLATDKPLLLYTLNATQSMGSFSINANTLHMNANKNTLTALPANLNTVSSSGLTTILTTMVGASRGATLVDEVRGNFFFSDNANNLYFWKPGMSSATTLMNSYPILKALMLSTTTGKLYIGHESSTARPLRVYDPTTSTLGTLTAIGDRTWTLYKPEGYEYDSARGLLYFGATNYKGMYNETTGQLTTVHNENGAIALNPTTGAVFLSDNTGQQVRLWIPNSGGTAGTLTTIATGLTGVNYKHDLHPIPSTDNKVIIGDNNGLYFWQNGQPSLSTLYSFTSSDPCKRYFGSQGWTPYNEVKYQKSCQYDATRNVFYFSTSSITTNATFAYSVNTNTLTTLTPINQYYGNNSLVLDEATGNLYIGNAATTGNRNIYEWNPDTNTLTTLVSGVGDTRLSMHLLNNPKELIFSSYVANRLYRYNLQTRTLITDPAFPNNDVANESILYDEGEQTVVFFPTNGGIVSYNGITGLTTLAPLASLAASYSPFTWNTEIDINRKLVLLSSFNANQPVYIIDYSKVNPATVSGKLKLLKTNVNGVPQSYDLINIANNKVYSAIVADPDNTLYVLNTTDGTLEHYTYYTATKTYNLTGSGTLNVSYYTNTSALALDQASDAIWLLQPASKTLYQFANRKASGSWTPAITASVNQNTSPTGVAMDQRNGHLYVIDSNKTGNNITLRRYNASGAYLGASYDVAIDVSTTGLGAGNGATTETAFKIEIDEIANILYLIAPSLGKVYALSMPLFKDS